MNKHQHIPVMLEETLQLLQIDNAHVAVDCTLGDGGHTQEMLKRMPADGVVIGIDRDPQALERAGNRLAGFGERFRPVQGNFSDIQRLLAEQKIESVDAILADLGVSTLQISDADRGFMFSESGPLRMKMDNQSGPDAKEIINETGERELADLIYQYGEEKKSRQIAREIVRRRQEKQLTTTDELADAVRAVVGERFVIKSLARVFQSIRIVVNQELASLEHFLPDALSVLNSGGRLAIIEYHSLESRLVKKFIYEQTHPCTCPKELPQCICGKTPTIKVVKKVKPSPRELEINPKSRSARLRVVEKL